jgi:zinc protease
LEKAFKCFVEKKHKHTTKKNNLFPKYFQKIQNKFENDFVNANSSVEGIAGSLATYYMLYGDTSLINKQIDIYRSITREEIQQVAQQYLQPNQRVVIDYLPQSAKQ